jgi:hypothetical protein
MAASFRAPLTIALWYSPLYVAIFVAVLFLTACSRTAETSKSMDAGEEWHQFEGTWTAAGTRQIMPMGTDRQVSLGTFGGSLVLEGPSRPGVGFRGDAIVLNDSVTGMIGRAVWTDEHGDQAFSELRGGGSKTNNRITGDFVGGTGRYSGAKGTYEFSWRFLLENEDGTVQGQSVGLKGRVSLISRTPRVQSGVTQP